jgi:hypothetical protein
MEDAIEDVLADLETGLGVIVGVLRAILTVISPFKVGTYVSDLENIKAPLPHSLTMKLL